VLRINHACANPHSLVVASGDTKAKEKYVWKLLSKKLEACFFDFKTI
jgi:hypothetical protein